MKKILLVLTVVLVGSLAASAAPVVFNFQFDGFCDYMQTIRYTPSSGVIPKKILAGTHFVGTPCGLTFDSKVGGFQHGNPLSIAPNVTPVNDYSDPIEGLYGINESLQYLVHEPTLTFPNCVWANYISNGSVNYLIFTGTCTRFSPAGAAPKGRVPGKSTIQR